MVKGILYDPMDLIMMENGAMISKVGMEHIINKVMFIQANSKRASIGDLAH